MTAVGVALAPDLLAQEPPPAVHPVVAVGRYLERAQRRVPAAPPARAVLAGGAAWALGAGLAAAAGAGCAALARQLPPPVRDLARGTEPPANFVLVRTGRADLRQRLLDARIAGRRAETFPGLDSSFIRVAVAADPASRARFRTALTAALRASEESEPA